MALQLTRVHIVDSDDVPVEGAIVSFNDTVAGQSFFAATDAAGKAELPLEESVYSVSASKPDFITPPAVRVEVAPIPGPSAAVYNPPSQAAPSGLGPARKNIKLAVDGADPVVIDVTGGLNVTPDHDDVVTYINAALGSAVAQLVNNEIRLSSTTTGPTSSLVIYNDGSFADPAVDLIFGLTLGAGNIAVTGSAAPSDWNDFDLVLTPYGLLVAADPDHCILYAKFYRNQLDRPLAGAAVVLEVVDAPTAIDIGVDVGGSIELVTGDDGYLQVELMRGARVRMYFTWLDKEVEFQVPEAASLNLERVLFPYIETIELEPADTVSVEVGKTTGFSVIARLTDGTVQRLSPKVYKLTYVSSDSATASFDAYGTLSAKQVGSVQVYAQTRNSKHRLLTTQPATVTVI